MNVLVDTSVWSLALRRKPADLTAQERLIVDELVDLTREGRARVIGLVRQELLSGIRMAAQYEKLRLALRAFPDELVGTADYEAAAKGQQRLPGIGNRGFRCRRVDLPGCPGPEVEHIHDGS